MLEKANRESKKGTNKLLYALLALSIVAIAVCTTGMVLELRARGQSQSYYAALSAAVATPEIAPTPSATNATATEAAAETEEEWKLHVDFDAIRETVPDLQAWIYREGTNINYPIVQAADNDYYLKRLPNKERNSIGSIFLDYRNAADFSDKTTLVYGHHVKRGEMFGVLSNYYNQEYYDEHPVMSIHTPEKDYDMVLFAGYVLDSGRETPPLTFADEAAFLNYVANIQRRSVFKSTVEVGPNDRLVCLCTCAYAFDNARLIIVGKLVEQP